MPLFSTPRWACALVLVFAGPLTDVQAAPVISEFMAANKSALADEDGDYSDWIEIHNPDAAPADLTGWRLTDSAATPGKWTFPAVTMAPGDFLTVFASGKNRLNPAAPLHTNFSLSANGEYLALSAPEGTLATEFAPAYPEQRDDISYGSAFQSVSPVTAGGTVRWLIPAGSTSPAWMERGFNDSSWFSGPTGLGFGLLVPGMTVTEVQTSYAMGSLAAVDAALAATPSPPNLVADTRIRQMINFLGESSDGRFVSGNESFVLSGETHGLRATGFLVIPTAGTWTFGVNSDDGSRLRIDRNGDGDFNDAGEEVIVDDSGHGAQDIFGIATGLTAGSHRFELVYFENYGGDEVEFFARNGSYNTWNTGFRLVGDTANSGLAVLTSLDGNLSGSGAAVATEVQSVMQGVNASCYTRATFSLAGAAAVDALGVLNLKMRYNDGFAAWLNGVEVARRNAPGPLLWNSSATGTRSTAESLTEESVNLTAFRSALVTGANVLAVQGLNTTANDSSFLLLPELEGGGLTAGGPFFYRQSTPGAINSTTPSLGAVADTTFSVKRGIFTEPFTLNLTTATPGASLRYTTDGTIPTLTNGILVPPPDTATPPAAVVTVGSTRVIRVMAFKADYDSTNVDTNTYLFPADIIRQQADGAPPSGWPSGPVNGQVLDYGMDPDIVNSATPANGGAAQVMAALRAIPSVCVTVPVESLVDPATGIYTHANQDGHAWEREASIEMINDPASPGLGFQENCGLRIRGGFSRSSDNPKHAFRILFRSRYGAGKLEYPLFPDDPTAARVFDKFDIQTAQNYSWSFQNDGSNTFLRELWSRDTQLALNQPATRGRFVNLYLNGNYWGLYQIQERAEADYAASYFGGEDSDYDVVKVETTAGYTVNPTAGDLDAWTEMWDKARASYFINSDRNPTSPYAARTWTLAEKNTAYFKLMGLAADGVTPTADPVLVDVDNLIDYMMIVFLAGNGDAPLVSNGTSPNNFYSIRDRRGGRGFLHFQHDGEHSLNAGGAVSNRTGPYTDPVSGSWNQLPKSNPQFTHQDLTANEEYRLRFADRVHQHLVSPDGALNTDRNKARMNERAAIVEGAIIAESARWGDAKRATPYTAGNWRSAVNSTINWFTSRNATVLNQLRAARLYPVVAAPVMSPAGGSIASNTPVTMTSTASTIYYTVNGPDPRRTGGSLHPAAQVYSGVVNSRVNFVSEGPSGSAWRYLDDGSDQGTAWRQPGFNDTSWKGPATGPFGYGETDLTTTVEYGPSDSGKYLTTWFRTTFNLADPAGLTNLTFEARRDDGIVVYLNGTEIARSNLAAGAVNHLTTASNAEDDGDDWITFSQLPLNLLQTGSNVLAVEVHQSGGSSSDLTFDGRLFGTFTTGTATSLLLAGPGPAVVRTRVRDDSGTWSALNEQEFLVGAVPAAQGNLVVSKLMYHPVNPSPAEVAAGFTSDQSFQWLELLNTGSGTLDLRGAAFTMGITFRFPDALDAVTLLPPGGRLLLCENREAFLLRYGAALESSIAGEFGGALAHGGERLVLNASGGAVIIDFTYDDAEPWPVAADGGGRSLVLIHPGTGPDGTTAGQWRASAAPGGSPGISDATTFEAWQAAHGGVGAAGDGDHDGLDNLMEYALGSDPAVPSTLPLPRLGVAEFPVGDPVSLQSFLTLTWQRSLAAEDLTWQPEQSVDSASADWTPLSFTTVSSTVNGDSGTTEETVRLNIPYPPAQGTPGRNFIRLRVTRN